MDSAQLQERTAFVFPGQGSQSVGMGLDVYQAFASARQVFHTADEVLGTPLTELIFNGPEHELKQTINAQPAILVTSLAYLKALEEVTDGQLPTPVFTAGHSLGEYTALVASGALSMEDGIRLARERGRLMQQASEMYPGGMAAIVGLDEMTTEEICAEAGVQIANINSDDQVVISGDKLSLARAMDMALARGARKVVPLQVSGAFHSQLMWPAQRGLAELVRSVPLGDPRVPVVANCSACPLTTAEQVREELVKQLCGPVLWKHSVRQMRASGVQTFLEFGPGRVLSSLIRRIDRSAQAVTARELLKQRTDPR